ncbi:MULTISPECIES: LolA-like protein [Niastella]|uniref:Outer membrane lipoprotein-sorting protein n=1 Tax=Niastella soli TaxID=2821487 RepID=A0ABS3YR90_9BACT|nr:hypothetical protein [Niastella soli]MBO9200419.1 hypothetical protein [Niastella soli]
MRSFKIALLAAGMLAVASVKAQTVDEIVNKHLDAMGGKEKLGSLKSVYTEYNLNMNGHDASGATWVVNGKACRNEINFGGQKIVQCFAPNSAWAINPFMGQTTPTAMSADEVKAGQSQFDLTGPFYNYAAKGNTIELLGKETVDGKEAFKLSVKIKEGGREYTSWIDATTGYLVKEVIKSSINGMDVETTMKPSDYKKTENGYVMPLNMEFNISTGLHMVITNTKVEVNKEIEASLFEMPKQ